MPSWTGRTTGWAQNFINSQGSQDPNYWQSGDAWRRGRSNYDITVQNAQERGRPQWESTQAWLMQKDPQNWQRLSEQMRSNNPDYWNRWYAPFYRPGGMAAPNAGGPAQSVLNQMYGG